LLKQKPPAAVVIVAAGGFGLETTMHGDLRTDMPMTRGQAARLKELATEALEPEAYSSKLSAPEAALRIHALEAKLRLQDGPPHTL
jgi:hypothetical protein